MADSGAGIIFTQSGVNVEGSADYQRVYDSRWKFMEVEIDQTIKVELPAVPAQATQLVEKTTILQHNLGFVPFFETDLKDPVIANPAPVLIFADKTRIFLRRKISSPAAPARSLTIVLRVYNLNVLEAYAAPKGSPQGTTTPRSTAGVKFLDGRTHGVDISDNSSVGFSVDSSKKILSIHRHGLAKINDYRQRAARVSSIDTSTNVLTCTSLPSDDPDITWLGTRGHALTYSPFDFSTWPAPLSPNISYYVIPVSSTTIKLATTYENAMMNVEIDLTTAGSLPGLLRGAAPPGDTSGKVFHDVGYPPTYLMATLDSDSGYLNDNIEAYLGPMLYTPPAMISADDKYLDFAGVQSIAQFWLAYVVLKDPAEIAR